MNVSFSYVTNNGIIEPIIYAQVRLPGKDNWSEQLEFLVDTGSSEDVLLNSKKFNEFGYDNLNVVNKEAYLANDEKVDLKTIESILKIGNYTKNVTIATMTKGNEENLIGFYFLLDLVATFDSPNSMLKLTKS